MADVDRINDKPLRASSLGGWKWFAVYALLSLVIQWPLVGSLTTHISYGHERDITVPLLNLWTVWWNADRAAVWFHGYWNSPIFYPTEKTFLFSEAQPTSLIVAPILVLTGNRGLAYNVYQLLILTLNGYSAHRLLRRVGHIRWLAFCGGVMSQILPFVMWQFGVVQLTTLFGIYWTLHALLDLFGTAHSPAAATDAKGGPNRNGDFANSRPDRSQFRLPAGIRLGFDFGLTYWLCNYWGLFLTLLLAPSSVWFWNRHIFARSFWLQLLWATLIAFVMIGPIAWLQRSSSREHDWNSSRPLEMVRDLSAHWRDHTDVPWPNLTPWLEFPDRLRANVSALGGGGLKLLLVPIGIVAALASRRRRWWGAFAASFGAIAFGLSLGPTIRFADGIPIVGGICPYQLMQQFVPGFSLIRSPFRFCLFVQLSTVWLTIEALDLCNPMRWMPHPADDLKVRKWRLPRRLNPIFGLEAGQSLSVAALLPLVVASTVVTLEAVPPTTRLYELPSRTGIPVWVQWLRDNAEPDQAVACLPFPTGTNAADYEETAVWMYWSTFYKRPLVNGYSGFFPKTYCDLKEGLEQFQPRAGLGTNDFLRPKFNDYSWDNPGLRRLNEGLVRYVVVKRSFGSQKDISAHSSTRFRWSLVASDEAAEIDVYQLPVWDE